MKRLLKTALLLVGTGLATVLAAQTPPAPQTPPQTPPGPRQTEAAAAASPRLLVIIVLDQFRADFVEQYGQRWTKGLRRLLDGGAVFQNAAYPYAGTYTCAGHATIGTGTFPATHGMSGNTFYDRTLRRTVPCAFDGDVASVPFGGGIGKERHSPRSLLVPTFTDELRRQARQVPQIVSLGQKPRTAITMAGKGGPGTMAVWEEDDGTWATSDAFTKTAWPEVDDFVRAHPMNKDYGQVWTLLMPPSAYRYTDDGAGEARPAPWTRTFPHPVISTTGKPDMEFVTAWERSPLDDAFLTDMAIHLLQTLKLGTGTRTDMLTLSLPSLDHNGHEFGPRSFEVQDVLFRLDIQIGRLLDAITAQVGPNFVVALSSDHGSATVPEQVTAEGGDAGRVSTTDLRNAINGAVRKVMSLPAASTLNFVASIYEENIALTPGVVDQVRMQPGGLDAVKSAIAGVKGVAAVFSGDDILGGAASTDPVMRAWRLSYVPGRSGDFVLTPRANWIVRSVSGTTHGTLNPYDQRIPLILYGGKIRSGQYPGAASPADIVTTFGALTGVQLARAQGRVLTEALVR